MPIAGNCRILWAEDDRDDVFMIQEMAGEMGIENNIQFVENGLIAYQRLVEMAGKKELPNLVILDCNMPVLTGYDTLLLIKKNPLLMHLPVIFFTTAIKGIENQFVAEHARVFIKPGRYEDYLRVFRDMIDTCDREYGVFQNRFQPDI